MNLNFTKSKVITIVVILLSISIIIAFFIIKNSEQEHVAPELPPVETEDTYSKHSVIGLSVEGRDIESYTYGNGKSHVVFIGGIHGGYEWNSVYLAYRLIDYINDTKDVIPKNVTVSVIPSANPDGLFKITGKEGRFDVEDVPDNEALTVAGRFNANDVDLNRNFDCKWKSEGTWRENTVSAGTKPFSEPESVAIKDFIEKIKPDGVVFWHSQANTIFASACEEGALPETIKIMNVYSLASGYKTAETFDAYEVTGDAGDWLSTIGIPSITIELEDHNTIAWDKNLAGIKAIFEYYNQ